MIVDLYSSPCGCMQVPSLVPGTKGEGRRGRGGGGGVASAKREAQAQILDMLQT